MVKHFFLLSTCNFPGCDFCLLPLILSLQTSEVLLCLLHTHPLSSCRQQWSSISLPKDWMNGVPSASSHISCATAQTSWWPSTGVTPTYQGLSCTVFKECTTCSSELLNDPMDKNIFIWLTTITSSTSLAKADLNTKWNTFLRSTEALKLFLQFEVLT